MPYKKNDDSVTTNAYNYSLHYLKHFFAFLTVAMSCWYNKRKQKNSFLYINGYHSKFIIGVFSKHYSHIHSSLYRTHLLRRTTPIDPQFLRNILSYPAHTERFIYCRVLSNDMRIMY